MQKVSSYLKSIQNKYLQYSFYIWCFFVFIAFNTIVFNGIEYLQNTRNKTLLDHHAVIVSRVLGKDLKLLSKGKQISSSGFLLQSNNNAIHALSNDSGLFFSVPSVKALLGKLLPKYIVYQLDINNEILASNKNLSSTISSNNVESINAGNFHVKMQLNEHSLEYTPYVYNKNQLMLISIISSLVVILLFARFYYLRIFSIDSEKQTLEGNYMLLEESSIKLINAQKIYNDFQKLFMQKATQMYVQEELEKYNYHDGQKFLANISEEGSIFPLVLSGTTPTTIDIEEIKIMMQSFFANPKYSSNIEIKTNNISSLLISCEKEVFYQIILSLAYNIVGFMDDQSDVMQTLIPIEINIAMNYTKYN